MEVCIYIVFIFVLLPMQRSDAISVLQQAHHKCTKTRLRLLETIYNNVWVISAYAIKQKYGGTIDITTIYRNLELFVQCGIIHKIEWLGGYIWCSHTHCCAHHDLVLCTMCHSISERHIDPIVKIQLWLSMQPVQVYGICTVCQKV